jgi:hypothetical protein
MSEYDGRQFVGIDLHRRRSVMVRTTDGGDPLKVARISNDADSLAAVIAGAGEAPEVVLEATYGWYWAVDALEEAGARVHLAHPLGVKGFAYRGAASGPGPQRDSHQPVTPTPRSGVTSLQPVVGLVRAFVALPRL